jgi:hypothetical protein
MSTETIYYYKTLPTMAGSMMTRASFINKDYFVASSGSLFSTNKIPSQETLDPKYSQGVVYFS